MGDHENVEYSLPLDNDESDGKAITRKMGELRK